MYDFFVQPQIDESTNSTFGCEVLLREKTAGKWHLPADFTELSIPQQVDLIVQVAEVIKSNPKYGQTISFNLNEEQAKNPTTGGDMVVLSKYIYPLNLIVELTEAVPCSTIQNLSNLLHQHHIELVIDDVGTGSNTYENIKSALPYVDRIKFAMQNLRMSKQAHLIPKELNFWVQTAQKYCLDIILEGVENCEDRSLARKLGINIQQGYLYGKPTLI